MPLGLAAAGANRHDQKLLEATLDAVAVTRPQPAADTPQHLCLDKGYDAEAVRKAAAARGYRAHIRSRGEERRDLADLPGYQARRWVVERTHSWLNRCRRLLVRWEKKLANHRAFLLLAAAFIAFRAAKVIG